MLACTCTCIVPKQHSTHLKAGHYRPASEMPFEWHFAGGPMVAGKGFLMTLHKIGEVNCDGAIRISSVAVLPSV